MVVDNEGLRKHISQRILTELRQIDGRLVALNIRRGAHIPKHREREGDNGQEAKRKDPHDVQNVRDAKADGTGNTTTHTRPPRSIDLVAGSACC